jgi:hypothetical protein
VLPKGSVLPQGLSEAIAQGYDCIGNQKCSVLLTNETEALLFKDNCFAAPKPTPTPSGKTQVPASQGCRKGERFRLGDGKWQVAPATRPATVDELSTIAAAYAEGQVEIRTVPRRQAYVGGVPVGDPFE